MNPCRFTALQESDPETESPERTQEPPHPIAQTTESEQEGYITPQTPSPSSSTYRPPTSPIPPLPLDTMDLKRMLDQQAEQTRVLTEMMRELITRQNAPTAVPTQATDTQGRPVTVNLPSKPTKIKVAEPSTFSSDRA